MFARKSPFARGSGRPAGLALTVAVVVTLAPGVTSFTASATTTSTGTSSVAWGDCPSDVKVVNTDGAVAKCTTIRVPVDYQDPAAGSFDILATGFIPAGTPKGVIFGNPGGPGGSALDFWGDTFATPRELFRDYILIGLQPRGLLHGTSLQCSTAQTCTDLADDAYKKTLTTENIARDMDELRKALGVEKIDYYGASWGTELGAAYATLFPRNVDKMILDSNIDPVTRGVGAGELANARAEEVFERRLYDFFDWAAANNSVFGLGDTPYKVYSAWNSARLVEDPKSWVFNYLPPELRANDLPPAMRADANAILPDLNATIRDTSKRDFAARLAAAASRGEVTSTAVAGGYPESPLLVNATTFMYTRRNWSLYADQIDLVLRPIDTKALARLADPTTINPAATALLRGVGALSPYVGHAGTTAAEGLSATQGVAVNASSAELGRTGSVRDTPDPKFVTLRDEALQDLERARAAGESTPTLRAKAAIARAFTYMSWGYVNPAPWSGDGLTTAPLLLQSLTDPATGGGESLAEALGGHLITVEGGDHGVFRIGNTTVDRAVLDYLASGTTDITRAPETAVTAVDYLKPVRDFVTRMRIASPQVTGPTIPDTDLNRLLSTPGPNVDAVSVVPRPVFAPRETPATDPEPAPAALAAGITADVDPDGADARPASTATSSIPESAVATQSSSPATPSDHAAGRAPETTAADPSTAKPEPSTTEDSNPAVGATEQTTPSPSSATAPTEPATTAETRAAPGPESSGAGAANAAPAA
ncbi:TAP domain protein OS=Tsukamurella paurometabola (strain ATCC 8368 / DSM / CCUG 35730 / CIP 100753 / JCM 10117 / KCTC 9821 / NBRC 16120 / NCIMB 702349 /NCTC 13040) OX=521096 GN=Tpau_3412 PE=3 SV=1 [Tsukamurella paurometabola]|uniref:TAP domain protein n=1 Tax=Tsukamurella paurometabola (strain ATCC 8368 / DSM 20162 / CCUG 35730 / CIP 100753 / JCM 10117 / KCTC 9821 / NBRC 16120 / NCIMB 702349 / NCTC 13040) TaxID=521096 RepID=D5UWJ7_TSUPD|nr:alpha/beta fold hydrolase [Tsukamurella paurometabola]ADG79996.1 TAP domain protein [Tsukamurella paurometabola DSM 20162]SUP37977.1 Tripeptidyl aminopeptidase precursor [Tsukamurella paurometabola]